MEKGVWGHRPVLEGGREGGGGGGSGHSHSQPKILTLSHILPPELGGYLAEASPAMA